MPNKQTVQLNIESRISQDEDNQLIASESMAEVFNLGSKFFIDYQEEIDGQVVAVRIKVDLDQGQVLIKREGQAVSARIPLILNRDSLVYYRLPGLPQLEMIAHMQTLAGNLTKNRGQLKLYYQLRDQTGEIGQYEIILQYQAGLV
ncbi:hypothetical protein AWM75_03960 [Aerococcus urinaehominis]|uniref:Uncharacterized protein n=1 Tax=Aerococcus urinaehominis TaxID=128944 RepID=A0A0X8FKW9_9LACT|nr:DUF1934 domain-containing protein [Aerococcus urinaehominis]AMB99211.1 hypothetical protein AWM75_03960 [Aerococcus urinaehominis]SDM32249.1 Uncharacterized beta-barrel protein YwiB, DUF1934 family [Aerococcus urinaehominis]